MSPYAQNLLEYDRATEQERTALLKIWFSDKEMQRLFRTVAENLVIRSLLEYRTLGVVPFEDFQKLQKKGLIENHDFFQTYVPVARGCVFPRVRLTRKGETLRIQGVKDRNTEQLCYEPFEAYRVRETGNGVVASRETLEEWLDSGNEDCLDLLVDPRSGTKLEKMIGENAGFFAEICDPDCRDELAEERKNNSVDNTQVDSSLIYSPR